ncbi:Uncharacterized protein APZ42_029575 [Daphnia magna]|uniref:Uncharacterized protein n=1 Tax=Daphnia magna TaxID=35525 RepID=A0A164PP98_9CRUS|nr:Uncharacterized protein APZ42_029575 [Daphnia magna]
MAVDQLKSPSSQLKRKTKSVGDVASKPVGANVRPNGHLQPEGAIQRRRWWREFSTPSRLRRFVSTIV